MATEALPEHIGPYQVVDILGKGGMGSVYKAFKPPLRRYVAVKIIKAEFTSTPGALERFRREAELASDLKHPNIVTVFDYEEVPNGDSYIVTELIEGGQTLRDRLMAGPLDLEETARILRQISSALDYAYEKAHIVHRDIKPTNIFLESGSRVALGDFGIAKDISSDTALTAVNQGVGTPDYMSPEQAMGEQLDRRSDIYSLGVVLYEMLTGSVPFKGDTPISVVMAHIQKPVPDLRQINPNFSPAIQAVVTKAMAKKKEDRYSTASAMTEAFMTAIKNFSNVQTSHDANDATQPITPSQVNIINTQLAQVGQLENQNRFQEAFDRLEELQRQFPQEPMITGRYQRYRSQGYVYRGNTSSNFQGSSTGGSIPQMSGSYMPVTGSPTVGGQGTISPARYPNTPKKSSPVPLVIGGVAALLVVAAIVLVVILATGGNSTEKNATATAVAIAALPTATAIPPTATAVPPTATAVPPTATAVPPTATANPVAQAQQLAADGDKLFDQKNYKDAITKYQAASQLDPTSVHDLEYLTRSYFNLDDYKNMEAPAKSWVALQANNASAQYYLGIAYYETFRAVDAENAFRQAAQIKPDEALYQRYVANALIDQERYSDAQTFAQKAVDLNAAEPENHNTLGRTYYEQGKYPEGEKEFRTALSQNSTSAIYAYNLAISLNQQGRYPDGEAAARTAIKSDSNYAAGYRALSIALRNQNKNDEALQAAIKGGTLDPKDNTYPTHAAIALINLKRYPEAETYARKGVSLNSSSDFSQNTLGDTLYNQGKYKEALDAYNAAIKSYNRSYLYYTNIGDTYAKLGQYSQARDSYNRALALQADYKPALDGLAAIKGK